MQLSSFRIELTKRHPLTISRGTFAGSTNLVVQVDHDGISGWGEVAPTDVGQDAVEDWEEVVGRWSGPLAARSPLERQAVHALLDELDGPVVAGGALAAVRCGLDVALWDWLGRRVGLPVWQLLGGDRAAIVPTSVTIGILAPEVLAERVPEILSRTGARVVKVKLGQPAGPDADRELLAAAQDAARAATRAGTPPVTWRVDANGGWTLDQAVAMCTWLADRDVELVEQPLPVGAEPDLVALRDASPLPIVADESVRTAADVATLADRVDGVNLKLLKCGGIGPALDIVRTARVHRLSVMIGCMGESSLGIAAGAQLAPFVDHLDLDSHLNLLDDPFVGAAVVDGVVGPTDRPGLGVGWAATADGAHDGATP